MRDRDRDGLAVGVTACALGIMACLATATGSWFWPFWLVAPALAIGGRTLGAVAVRRPNRGRAEGVVGLTLSGLVIAGMVAWVVLFAYALSQWSA